VRFQSHCIALHPFWSRLDWYPAVVHPGLKRDYAAPAEPLGADLPCRLSGVLVIPGHAAYITAVYTAIIARTCPVLPYLQALGPLRCKLQLQRAHYSALPLPRFRANGPACPLLYPGARRCLCCSPHLDLPNHVVFANASKPLLCLCCMKPCLAYQPALQ
jgi:hypothetical protein